MKKIGCYIAHRYILHTGEPESLLCSLGKAIRWQKTERKECTKVEIRKQWIVLCLFVHLHQTYNLSQTWQPSCFVIKKLVRCDETTDDTNGPHFKPSQG